MSAKIIAFLNFKGGVGKTANTVNIGACLAHRYKKKVLVVDLDPQCNSTYWLLRYSEFEKLTGDLRETERVQRTTFQIFQDAIQETSVFKPEDAIIQGVPRNEFGLSVIPHLHILPAAVDLLDIEFHLDQDIVHRLRPSLSLTLGSLRQDYDYILLDCPPNIYHVSQTAVMAADHIVVPYNPDNLSLSGFKILCHQIKKFNETVMGASPQHSAKKIAAVTVNQFQKVGLLFESAKQELLSMIDIFKKQHLVHPRCTLLEPPVRRDIKVGESTSWHKPVIIHDPKSIGAQDYFQLAESFITHFEVTL